MLVNYGKTQSLYFRIIANRALYRPIIVISCNNRPPSGFRSNASYSRPV